MQNRSMVDERIHSLGWSIVGFSFLGSLTFVCNSAEKCITRFDEDEVKCRQNNVKSSVVK